MGALILFNELGSPVNLVGHTRGADTGDPGYALGSERLHRLGRAYDNTDYTTFNGATTNPVHGEYTLLVALTSLNAANWDTWGGMIAKRSTGSTGSYAIQRNGGNSNLICWHGGSSVLLGIDINTELTDNPHVLVTRYDGATFRSYLDGVRKTSTSFTTDPGTGESEFVLNTERTLAAEGNSTYYAVAMWNRALPEEDCYFMSRQPDYFYSLAPAISGREMRAFRFEGAAIRPRARLFMKNLGRGMGP